MCKFCNKEYANLYIDDMTIGQHDLFNGEKSKFTGNRLIFTEKTVKKYCKSALFEFEWYKNTSLKHPQVLFCNDELIITERLNPTRKVNAEDMISILHELKHQPQNQDFQTYLDNIPPHPIKDILLEHEGTNFHGDLSTTNSLDLNTILQ